MAEFQESKCAGLFGLRNASQAGGTMYYHRTRQQILDIWQAQTYQEDWYCSQQIPKDIEDRLLIQGEVMLSWQGLYLFFSTQAGVPMRIGLASSGREAIGLLAVSLLRVNLCANSYEWLQELLERYPGHVVEFSTFSRKFGSLPNYNTIFWEVRNF